MRDEDKKFTKGKGHICKFCEKYGECNFVGHVANFAKSFWFLDEIKVTVIECRKFQNKMKPSTENFRLKTEE